MSNPCPDSTAGTSDDVLECQDLKSKLKARSPLCCCTCRLPHEPTHTLTVFAAGTVHFRHMITLAADLVRVICLNQRLHSSAHMSRACAVMSKDIIVNPAKLMAECVVAASDGDRVALQSMRFATPRSAGATCMTLGQLSKIQNNDNGSAPPRSQEAADDQVSCHISCLQCSLCSRCMLELTGVHVVLLVSCIFGVWLNLQLAQDSLMQPRLLVGI